MTIKDLIADYKSDIEVIVKQLEDDEPVEVVSFNVVEKDAIKDDILEAEVSKWNIETALSQAKITVLIKTATAGDPVDPIDPTP